MDEMEQAHHELDRLQGLIAALFLVFDSRHANLVEAVVERAVRVESLIRGAARDGTQVDPFHGRGDRRLL
jgi:hypothetical protein